ncbi:MAG: hypothetical protein M3N42_12090 [Cyanobacteriota bacterium]|nr:hypothetical protein [Cyanobacteriota bacterium]
MWQRRAIDKKKPQTKSGRELINQGASTNLISRRTAPLSGHFGRICENLWRRRAIDHEFFHLGLIVEELELGKYGLEYLECDPVVFCLHPDGKYFLDHKTLEKTCSDISG